VSLAAAALFCGSPALQAEQSTPAKAGVGVLAPASRPAEPKLQMHRLTVRAAPATRPALQYRLLPDPNERTAGNAAPVYLLSFLQALKVPQEERKLDDADAARLGAPEAEKHDRLSFYQYEVPLDRLTDAKVEQFLGKFASALTQFDVAARRDHCDWDLPTRELGFGTLLPHLTSARDLANINSLRVRLAIARHDYRTAARGLQSGMSLGRDLGGGGGGGGKPLLVEALVGAGIGALALEQAETLVQQPDAPNLYWPLAELPRPFVDMPASIREERTAMVRGLTGQSEMRRMKEGRFSAEDWDGLIARLAHVNDAVGAKRPLETKLGPVATAVVLYPAAKQYLVGRGVPAAEVDAMPVPAALARFYVESFEEWWDELLKWTNLPFWEAYPGMQRAEDAYRKAETGFASNPLLTLMPTVSLAYITGVKFDRQVAALQTVEALRNYAATHDGRLPANLTEITDTPAPADPTTGKPFNYRVEGDRVALESPPPKGRDARDGLRVEVTFVK
jgi:hypothetical protein